MAIFRHRPLFLCCFGFTLASLAGFFLPLAGKLILGGCLLVGAVLFCAWRLGRRDRLRAVVGGILCLLVFVGLLLSHLWFFGNNAVALRELEGQTVTVTGTVTDRRGSGGFMTSYALELDSLDSAPVRGRVLLTCHYVSDLQPGHRVQMEVTVISLNEAAGDGYDATALMGDGYVAGLLSESEGTVTVTTENAGGLAVRAGRIRRALAARLNGLTPDAKGLPAALLLGDRTALADSLRRDFSRAGVSHLLAISGLHVTLLFGLLEGLLRLLRLPKRGRTVVLFVCALGYLTLLGFPPSATRAVVMLGAVYLSCLLSARADPLTSLGLAGALILAVTPYAVADAGFWMSYLATLGLVAVMPEVNRIAKERAGRTSLIAVGFFKALTGIIVGLVAMSFTLPVVAAVIGEMGILSPLSTLLLTPFCGTVLVLSLLALPFGGGVMGTLLGGLTEGVCGVMASLAAWMGDPSWAVVSLRHPAVAPIAFSMLAGALILLAVRLSQRKHWTVALPLLAGWIAIGGVLGIHALVTDGEMTVGFVQPSSRADMLVLTEGHEAVIMDLSNGSLTAMSRAARTADEAGATEIAVLMLTHYHSRTAGSLTAFLSRETVRALWLPAPDTEEEYYLLLSYLEKAEAAGVPVCLYGEGESLTLFGGCEAVLETTMLARSVQPVLLLSLDAGAGSRVVYCGSAVFESELSGSASALVAEADTVIFGNHGPLTKAPFGEGLTYREGATVILSGEGDAAGWFIPSSIEEQPLWLGEWSGKITVRP